MSLPEDSKWIITKHLTKTWPMRNASFPHRYTGGLSKMASGRTIETRVRAWVLSTPVCGEFPGHGLVQTGCGSKTLRLTPTNSGKRGIIIGISESSLTNLWFLKSILNNVMILEQQDQGQRVDPSCTHTKSDWRSHEMLQFVHLSICQSSWSYIAGTPAYLCVSPASQLHVTS